MRPACLVLVRALFLRPPFPLAALRLEFCILQDFLFFFAFLALVAANRRGVKIPFNPWPSSSVEESWSSEAPSTSPRYEMLMYRISQSALLAKLLQRRKVRHT